MASKDKRLKRFADVKKRALEALKNDPSLSLRELARRLKVHSSTISKYASEIGPPRQKLIDPAMVETIKERLTADPTYPYSKLAKELGIPGAKVAYWARKFCPTRRNVPDGNDYARWAQMFNRGTSIARIAQVSGFHPGTIGKALRRRGIDTVSGRDALAEEVIALAAAEGISLSLAAVKLGTTKGHVIGYRCRKKKKEQMNADSTPPMDVDRKDVERRNVNNQLGHRKQQTAGGGDAGHASLVGPPDLRTEKGRHNHSRLANSDAPERQAARERLRRCG